MAKKKKSVVKLKNLRQALFPDKTAVINFDPDNILSITYNPSTLHTVVEDKPDNLRSEFTLGQAVSLINKNISVNGTYNATDDSADGYKKVVVNVPNPSTGTLSVTANGTYDVTNYASADVNVSGGSISVGWATSVEIITIGANSVTNAQAVKEFFESAGYTFNLCILLDSFTVNNQFVWTSSTDKNTFPAQVIRWRNNGLGAASINVGYDCYLVEGTRYLLIEY